MPHELALSMTQAFRREPQTLEGPHVSLIPFREEDVCERYVGWLNDPEVNRYLEVRFRPQTLDTGRVFVRSFYGDLEKYMWGIYTKEPRTLVGTTTLHTIDRHHGSAEFGVMIGDRAAQGKRTAREVIELVFACGFEFLELRRILAVTYAVNFSSNFACKQAGFRHEGTFLQAYQVSPGKYVDGFRWAILAEEWRARKRAPHA